MSFLPKTMYFMKHPSINQSVRVWSPCSQHTSPGETLKLFQKNEHPTSRAAMHCKTLNQSQTPVMWPWPAKIARSFQQLILYNFTSPSNLHLHSQATQFQGLLHGEWHLHINTCSSPFGCLPWPSLPEQPHCVFMLNSSTTTPAITTSSSSSSSSNTSTNTNTGLPFHVWVLSPACLIRLQLLPLPLCFLHKTTTQAFSMFHHTAYWVAPFVINLFSHRKIFLCTLTCRWLCKSPSAFRKS